MVQDSLQLVHELVNAGANVIASHEQPLINGIPNTVTGSIITAIIGAVIRFFEKKRITKKSK